MGKKVMIYSNEHHDWWAKDYCGYTHLPCVFDYDDVMEHYPYLDYNTNKDDYLVDVEENKMGTKMYLKDTRNGRIYEVIEKMGEGWYRCHDLKNMNTSCFVEYNGEKDPNAILIESDNLKELVDVYAKNENRVYGYVKTKDKFGADKYIAATVINDDGIEMLVAKWVY